MKLSGWCENTGTSELRNKKADISEFRNEKADISELIKRDGAYIWEPELLCAG